MEHPAETRADDLWTAIAGRLRETLTDSTYDTWFGQARPQSVVGDRLVVEVPNDFTRDWIEGHFLDLVSRAAVEAGSKDAVVAFAVGERPAGRAVPAEAPVDAAVAEAVPSAAPAVALAEVASRETEAELKKGIESFKTTFK